MKYFKAIVITTTALMSIGCSPDTEEVSSEPEQVDSLGPGEVAYVDGERIPVSVFRLYTLTLLQSDADNLTPKGRAEVIDRLVSLQVLANEAERNGLDQERRIAAELEMIRTQVLARWMTERFAEENPPTEAELRATYELSLPTLRRTEYKTRHILVDTDTLASDLIAQISEGADFAELAIEHSTDAATAPEGGDLGWNSADAWIQPFAEAVEAATPGVLIDQPIETQYGWHVILVEDKSEQEAPGLESVRQDMIVATEQQKLNDYVEQLQDAAEVTVVE